MYRPDPVGTIKLVEFRFSSPLKCFSSAELMMSRMLSALDM
jgi:hypothetical protein